MANQGGVYGLGNYGTDIFGGQTASQPNTGQNLIEDLLGSVGPQLAQGALGIGATEQQIGLQNQNFGVQQAYNNAMGGYQQAGNQISGQQIGLQQLGNTQQQAQAQAQQGFTTQQQAQQATQFPEQYAEAALAYQNSLMQTQGQQAIGGTQFTQGGKAAINTLGQQYGFQQQDIARNQNLFNIGVQSEQSGYNFNQQQLQNAAQSLALNAQANGLSGQQLMTMLNYQNQQAGLGQQQNIVGLYSQLGQQELGQVSTAGSALSQLGFATNLNALAGIP